MDSFDELFHRHATPMLRLAVLLVGDRRRAEAVVRTAFAETHRRLRMGDEFDVARQLRTTVVAERPTIAPAETDERPLARALARLSARDRAIVVLHAYAELPVRDVGQLLDLPLGASDVAIAEADAALRSLLPERLDLPVELRALVTEVEADDLCRPAIGKGVPRAFWVTVGIIAAMLLIGGCLGALTEIDWSSAGQ